MTDAPAPGPAPAVLTLSADEASAYVLPGVRCPVCADASLDAYKLPGLTPGSKRPAVRCPTCGFIAPATPSLAMSVAKGLGACLIAGALALLGSQRGMFHLNAAAYLGVALVGAVYAAISKRMTTREIASRIAASRARWSREKEEHDFKVDPPALLAAAVKDADCPVCGKAKLEGPGPNPLWSRGNLRCPRCRLDVPMRFTEVGWLATLVVAAVLVVAGALVAKSGLQFQGNDFMYRVLIGLAVASAGVYVGFVVQASGDDIASKELERSKRRFERRIRGLAVKDDDEEPAVWFQENLEAVVVAVILALIIRHFVMEAFVIPTGSMAPTLLGDHFSVTCKNCGYHFDVAKREGDIGRDGERVDAHCPLCGTDSPDNSFTLFYPDVSGGNKILVNKFLYHFEPPERWNVIVFKYPLDPLRKNFIKRLVGLPGETLRIDARGDLLVKKPGGTTFELARKPRNVQEELWMPVYDSQFPDPKNQAWEAEGDVSRWIFDRKPAPGEEVFVEKPGAGEASLHYKKPIRDDYGYNPSGRSWGRNLVGDVRVRARVVPDKECKAVLLSTEENGRLLTARIPVGTGDVAILSSNTPDHEILRAKCAPIAAGTASDLALGYADERLTLVVNGEVVFEWDDPAAFAHTETSSVRLGSEGPGGARFDHVKIDRDLYYVPSGAYDPSTKDLEVPEDCYFPMGDNSPNSQDGRVFGFVHKPHMIGRAFLVFWPLWEVKLIR